MAQPGVVKSMFTLQQAAAVGGGGCGRRRHCFRRMVAAASAATPSKSARARSQSPAAAAAATAAFQRQQQFVGPNFWRMRANSFSSCSQLSSSCESFQACTSSTGNNGRDKSVDCSRNCLTPREFDSNLWGGGGGGGGGGGRRSVAQSWSSGLNLRLSSEEEGGLWASGTGRRRRSWGKRETSATSSSTLGLLVGAGLISQAAAAKKEEDESDENGHGEDDKRKRKRKRRRREKKEGECSRFEAEGEEGEEEGGLLLCRGIKLEKLDLEGGEGKADDNKEEEEEKVASRGDDGRGAFSVRKVGEKEGVTGAEEREDGEHIIVKVEHRVSKERGDEEEKKKRRRSCSVKAEEEKEGEKKTGEEERRAIAVEKRDSSVSEKGDAEEELKAAEATAAAAATKKKKNGKNGNGKDRVGFRDRKIIDYENRIRAYSTPDKIFRYFATLKSVHSDGEIFMTPEDFLRSLTPGVKQPEGLGLDQFKKFDPAKGINVNATAAAAVAAVADANTDDDDSKKGASSSTTVLCDEESIFFHLGSRGLISFSDYIFLLTILSTSRRQFEIAFRMFDLNGDGDVDFSEFEKVQEIIRQTTSNGKKHRDHSNTGSTIRKMNSALANYFFGENLTGKLTIERFLDFQHRLQSEILRLEFRRKNPDPETGRITERQFAELLLTYADYSAKKRSAVLKRVKRRYKNTEEQTFPGISLDDYVQIFDLLMNLEDVEKALHFHHLASASIDENTLKHVAMVTAGVNLSHHVVHVLFTIFDEDGDGGLSNKEFVSVMKNKLKRGLEKPKDTGLFNLFAAVTKCAVSTPGLSGAAGAAAGAAGAGGMGAPTRD